MYQRPDGRWTAQIDLGWVGGRRRRKTVYAKSEREVLAKRDQLRISWSGASTSRMRPEPLRTG